MNYMNETKSDMWNEGMMTVTTYDDTASTFAYFNLRISAELRISCIMFVNFNYNLSNFILIFVFSVFIVVSYFKGRKKVAGI